MLKTVIIIPTYNERGNVGPLITELQRQFAKMPHEMHILVVDDESPDGTSEVVLDLMGRYSNVHLLTGRKSGLGAAYIRGMRHAMDDLHADVLFEMDADFSHDPEDVPRLMAALEKGADFVIGSRYVEGGSIPPEWGFIRRMNSRFGNIAARYIAGLHRVRDCTAGFRAIRTRLLRKIDLAHLRVRGYAFQVALLHEAMANKAKIVEVPVRFVDRTEGSSKLGLYDIAEFLLNVWWIRFRRSTTFFRFGLVGLSGVVVNLGIFSLLLALGINKYLASPVAIQTSIVTNFLLNNYWTFRRRRVRSRVRVRGVRFNLVSVVALLVSYSTFVGLTLLFPNVAPQVHQLLGIIPAMLLNYFLNSRWTFKSEPARHRGV